MPLNSTETSRMDKADVNVDKSNSNPYRYIGLREEAIFVWRIRKSAQLDAHAFNIKILQVCGLPKIITDRLSAWGIFDFMVWIFVLDGILHHCYRYELISRKLII